MTLEKVGFDGEMESDRDLTKIVIKESKLSWGDIVTAKIKGEVANVKTEPRVNLSVEAEEKPLAPIIERIRSFRLAELAPKKQPVAETRPSQAPVEFSGGTIEFNAQIEGLAKEPLSMSVWFEGNLRNASMKAGEPASIRKMNAECKGRGIMLAWRGLFPGPEDPVEPAELGVAWRAVELDATIDIEGGEFLLKSPAAQAGAAGAQVFGGASATAAGSAGSGAPAPGYPHLIGEGASRGLGPGREEAIGGFHDRRVPVPVQRIDDQHHARVRRACPHRAEVPGVGAQASARSRDAPRRHGERPRREIRSNGPFVRREAISEAAVRFRAKGNACGRANAVAGFRAAAGGRPPPLCSF